MAQPKLQWQELEGGEWAAIVAGYALLATHTGAARDTHQFRWHIETHDIGVEADYKTHMLVHDYIPIEGFAPSLLAAEAKAEFAARRLLAADRKNIRLIAGSPARGKEK